VNRSTTSHGERISIPSSFSGPADQTAIENANAAPKTIAAPRAKPLLFYERASTSISSMAPPAMMRRGERAKRTDIRGS
jgi:hypothetical protein